MHPITKEQFLQIVPKIRKQNLVVVDHINKWSEKYGIVTRLDIAAFISQAAHECASFNIFEEIASGDAYDTRVDLGNTPEKDGDGRFFKGRGAFQTTGKNQYLALSIHLYGDDRLLKNPQVVATDLEIAIRSAMFYWKNKGLSKIANKPDDWRIFSKRFKKEYDRFEWLTILINGGKNGYDDRLAYYTKALNVLK